MKVILLNGSPRKNWNTDLLLQEAARGAQSAGAETELIQLYDLNFKGCRSCMACNTDGSSWGHCAWNDDLKDVLRKIDQADGLILGSPIYWGDVTREFLERFLFQYTNFDNGRSEFKGHLKAGFIYTMNAPAGMMTSLYQKYQQFLQSHVEYVGTLECAETLQVNDYTKVHLGFFDGEQRHKRREAVFPEDMKKAFALGKKVTE